MKKSLFYLLSLLPFQLVAQTTHIVTVTNFTYSPDALVINQGDIVQWNNTAGFHNVNGTIASNPTNAENFFSGAAASAPWSFSHTFMTIGTNNYFCDIHGAGMNGSITVTGPLPAEMIKFIANVKAGVCKLEWTTSLEDNIKNFTIQRSRNAIDFTDVYALNSNHKPSDYSFMDNMGIDRILYYRIKIEDNNNSIKYSPIRMAQNDLKISTDKLVLLPNPFVGHFHIQVESMTKYNASIEVYDMMGRLVVQEDYTMTEGINFVHLDGSQNFPKGNYNVVVKNNTKNEILSAIVTKQ